MASNMNEESGYEINIEKVPTNSIIQSSLISFFCMQGLSNELNVDIIIKYLGVIT